MYINVVELLSFYSRWKERVTASVPRTDTTTSCTTRMASTTVSSRPKTLKPSSDGDTNKRSYPNGEQLANMTQSPC